MVYREKNSSIGYNLRKLRENCGFSQKQIADAINVDRSTYTNYELGKICPPLNMIYRLANAFHVEYTQILEGERVRSARVSDSAEQQSGYPQNTYELSSKEKELLLSFRMMTAEDQIRMSEQVSSLSKKKRSGNSLGHNE